MNSAYVAGMGTKIVPLLKAKIFQETLTTTLRETIITYTTQKFQMHMSGSSTHTTVHTLVVIVDDSRRIESLTHLLNGKLNGKNCATLIMCILLKHMYT